MTLQNLVRPVSLVLPMDAATHGDIRLIHRYYNAFAVAAQSRKNHIIDDLQEVPKSLLDAPRTTRTRSISGLPYSPNLEIISCVWAAFSS